MSDDQHALGDPRVNRRHYMYAPYEGPGFIDRFVRQRDSLKMRCASILAARESREISGLVDDASDLNADPLVPSNPVSMELFQLAEAHENIDVRGRMLGHDRCWFFAQKIDVFHRLRREYNYDGRMATVADAGPDAYAFASNLLSSHLSLPQPLSTTLRWANPLLKALDVVSAMDADSLSVIGLRSVVGALEKERAFIRRLRSIVEGDR